MAPEHLPLPPSCRTSDGACEARWAGTGPARPVGVGSRLLCSPSQPVPPSLGAAEPGLGPDGQQHSTLADPPILPLVTGDCLPSPAIRPGLTSGAPPHGSPVLGKQDSRRHRAQGRARPSRPRCARASVDPLCEALLSAGLWSTGFPGAVCPTPALQGHRLGEHGAISTSCSRLGQGSPQTLRICCC